MNFLPTAIPGAYVVELNKHMDERGFFARGWCQREFQAHNLPAGIVQMNISFNRHRHTLRGFHYQAPPHQEDKLLRCIRGSLFDVLIDLRTDSPTYLHRLEIELRHRDYRSLLIPKGCANAFLTLEDDTEATYLVSEFYEPAAERGLRWNDPSFNIRWPAEPAVISDKDRSWPDFKNGVQATRSSAA
jgi:dTDP-4-dehydrorhamnose 3,5-epimerase